MKPKDIEKLIVGLMIITILTLITVGIAVDREVKRLEKVTICRTTDTTRVMICLPD